VDNVGYVLAGYLLTAGAITGYLWGLLSRARRAHRMAGAVDGRPEPPARA
jgi:hypothetical protein